MKFLQVVALVLLSTSGYAEFGYDFRADIVNTSFGEPRVARDQFAYRVDPAVEPSTPAADPQGTLNLLEAERERLAAIGAAKEEAMRQSEAAAEKERKDPTTGQKVKTHLANNWGWYAAGTALGFLFKDELKDGWDAITGRDDDKDAPPAVPEQLHITLEGVSQSTGAGDNEVTVQVNINSNNPQTAPAK